MRTPIEALIAALLLIAAPASLAAQELSRLVEQSGEERVVPHMVLGTGSGRPGETVSVPITFTAGEGNHFRRLALKVTLKSALVKFQSLERVPEVVRRSVEVVLEDHVISGEGRMENSTLTIRVAQLAREPERDIPSGILGHLKFRIDENSDGAAVDLFTSVEATEIGADRPLAPHSVQVTHGAVFILAPGFDSWPG
jgi:hypothetical protein